METRLRAALLDHLRADPALMDAINLVDEAEVERAGGACSSASRPVPFPG